MGSLTNINAWNLLNVCVGGGLISLSELPSGFFIFIQTTTC